MNPCEFLHSPPDTTGDATQGGRLVRLLAAANGLTRTSQVSRVLSVTGMARAGDCRC